MAANIIPKRSTVASRVPSDTDLLVGEISVNLTDGIIYTKHSDGTIVNLTGALELHTHTLNDIADSGDLAGIDQNGSTSNFLRGDGTWATPPDTDTTYSAGTGITLSGTTFLLSDERYTSAEKNKLSGIEPGATADQTKADIDALNIDADTLDGQHASAFAAANHTHNYDNYGGWALQTNGVGRGTITSDETVNLVGGANVTIDYSATNNTITVNADQGATTPNYYLDGLTFNTADGILTASVNGTTNQTVDLDGRYLLSGAKAADSDKLDNLNSTQFLRSDADDTATGVYTFTNSIRLTRPGIPLTFQDSAQIGFIEHGDGYGIRIRTREGTSGSGIAETLTISNDVGGGVDTTGGLTTPSVRYANAARNEGCRVEYNETSKSLEYNFF